MAKIGDLLVKIGADSRDLDKDLGKAMGKFRSFGRNMKRLGTTMSAAITAPMAAIAGSSFKVAMDFEASMAKVKAVSGATAEEFKALENQAKQLGKTTVFTASDVANLQTEFAKLGFTAQEIDQVTEATLYLAQATDSDLGKAAEVAGATLRGFGMDAVETGRVTDVMAKSFSTSALDMDSFADSMKYVAPVANAAGLSIEETTAMLGTLANAGIKGSQAGTALRRIIADMGSEGGPTTEKIAALAEKGMTLEDAFDEVGRSAQTALLVLSENTAQTTELTGTFDQAAGAAQGMADTMNDTSAGAMKRMQSAIEGAQIALGEALAPTMERMMGMLERAAGWFSGLSSSMRNTIIVIGGILAALGPLLFVLPQIMATMELLLPVFAGISAPILAAIAAIAAAVYLIYDNWDAIKAYFTEGAGATFFDGVVEYVNTAIGLVVKVFGYFWDFIQWVWSKVGTFLVDNWMRAFDTIQQVLGKVFGAITSILNAFTQLFNGNWRGFLQYLHNALIDAAGGILKGVEWMFGGILSTIDAGLKFLGKESDLSGGFSSFIDGLIGDLDAFKFKVKETEGETKDYLGMLADGFSGFSLFGGGSGGAPTAPGAGEPAGKRPQDMARMSGGYVDALQRNMQGMAEGRQLQAMGEQAETATSHFQSLRDSFKNMHADLSMTLDLSSQVEGAFVGLGMAVGGLIAGTMSMQDIFAQSLMGIANLLMDLGQQFIAAGVAAMSFYQSLLTNPAVAVAAGIGLVAAGAAIKGFQSRMESPPMLADGGLAYGMTSAVVGEYAGAKSNPEVIAPLSKLQGMLEGSGGNVTVTGRIAGKDIVLSNERGTRARNRVR